MEQLVAEFDSLEFTEEETDNWGAINKEADYYIP
jgi:hypothetical protein